MPNSPSSVDFPVSLKAFLLILLTMVVASVLIVTNVILSWHR